MNILVLGIGNVLLQDEGAGVRALEVFQKRYGVPDGVELLDGGTSGIELLQHIQGRDHLIIIDAVKGGNPPGAVIRLAGDEVPALFRRKISPHQLGIADVLAAAHLTGAMPGGVVLLGIEPASMDTGIELSPVVAESLGNVAQLVARELASLGETVNARLPA